MDTMNLNNNDAGTLACIECKRNDVPIKLYPQFYLGKIIAVFYCCDLCVGELLKIKLMKDQPTVQ